MKKIGKKNEVAVKRNSIETMINMKNEFFYYVIEFFDSIYHKKKE